VPSVPLLRLLLEEEELDELDELGLNSAFR
jgi:hypothetical protein